VSWLTLLAILMCMAGTPAVILAPRAHRWRWGAGLGASLLLVVVSAMLDDAARRTLLFACMPMGLAWLLVGGLATAAAMLGHRRWAGALLAVFALLTLGGNQRAGASLIASLESRSDPQVLASEERYDVVCVLGGGANRRFDGIPQLGPTGDRLRAGAVLFRQGRTPLLLTTGIFAADTRTIWEQLAIPPAQVLVEPAPDNTAQEIALIKRLAGERGWKRIGVVSSAWHLPRVARLASRQGLAVLPIASDWLGAMPPWTGELMVPKSEGAHLLELALKEHLGSLLGQ
jgi:uncharacterized SAM-binding protein YcdF (DUF218 family)